jgi:hypothetical protein
VNNKKPRVLSIALSSEVVAISIKMSLVVGTLLAMINHGSAILEGSLNQERVFQIALTYLVPYCVATLSSVKAIQKRTP